jgi:hypothetical protein
MEESIHVRTSFQTFFLPLLPWILSSDYCGLKKQITSIRKIQQKPPLDAPDHGPKLDESARNGEIPGRGSSLSRSMSVLKKRRASQTTGKQYPPLKDSISINGLGSWRALAT